MVDLKGMHFNTKKALYIHFQKHASIFCKEMLSTINGGGQGQCYVLLTSMCVNTNDDFPIEDRYSGIIFQNDLANILNVSQRFIKLLHQLTEPHRLVGKFPSRQNGNKELYNSINAFDKLKEDISEPIATRYVRDITDMTTRDEEKYNPFLPHHTSKHQYYAQWFFEHGSIFTKNN